MADTFDGDINAMRGLNPASLDDGQIFRSREASAPRRESIFMWDPTPYDGPLWSPPNSFDPQEVPRYVGFAPDIDPDGSHTGVWRWVDPPAGHIDAERVYGISPKESAVENAISLQRCVDEVLASDNNWDPQNPRPDASGEGDSWTVLLPAGTIEVDTPIVFNRKTPPSNQNCGTTEKITVAGRIILQGQGRTPRLVYTGDPAEHAFRVGGPEGERWAPGCIDKHYGFFVLRDLELQAATDAGFAVLRLWQARGDNVLQNVKVSQFGNGDGINANEIIFSEFNQVVVQRLTDTEWYPNQTTFSGRGFWIHTDEYPYLVSGQTILNRLSVFGSKTNGVIRGFAKGIVVGENADGARFVGSLSGQFINAEACNEGIVFGKGAVNVDFSGLWVEANQICGVRVYDGASHIALRRIYSFHTPPDVAGYVKPVGEDPPPLPPQDFEGDVVLGRLIPNTRPVIGWNAYAGIDIDGVFQHFVYGPAVRINTESGDLARAVTVRNVQPRGLFNDTTPGTNFGIIRPFAEAAVEIHGDGRVVDLVVEGVWPNADGTLYRRYPGPDYPPSTNVMTLVNRPDLVDRQVYAGPRVLGASFEVHEVRRQAPAVQERTHTASASLGAYDVTYHRVDASGGSVTLTLPDIETSGLTAPDRIGMEFHVIRTDGSSGTNVVVQGVSGQELVGQGVAADKVTLTDQYGYVRVRATQYGGGDYRWEVIGYFAGV